MSRVAKKILDLPSGVEVKIDAGRVSVKGPKGSLDMALHDSVEVVHEGNTLRVGSPKGEAGMAIAGTTRSLLGNMVIGVSQGFERKLELVGVGYRAQTKGNALSLSLGYSHPIEYPAPAGITIETPSQTEIVVRGTDKQQVGQVSAEIRGFRPPEPYKGKGVKYAGEQLLRKEAKKK
jgi:large subunit ribosomal protein L6